jgi:putative NADH-flavin reductase
LTNGGARGRVRSGEALTVGAMSSISRADLARFMLDEVESPQHVGQRVVVQS